MSAHDDPRRVSDWLHEYAAHRVPDHLDAVLRETSTRRQRTAWSSLERLLPMTTLTSGRLAARPAFFWTFLLALAVMALVGAVLIAGMIDPRPSPLGPASNGRIVVADGAALVSYAADGTDRTDLLDLRSARPAALAMSPDGRRVAMVVEDEPLTIRLVNVGDGTSADITVDGAGFVADGSIGWSPDGRSLVFSALRGNAEAVYVVSADGSTVTTPIIGRFDPRLRLWQPSFSPDGAWIAFAAADRVMLVGQIYVMRPDGSDLRQLATAPVSVGPLGGPSWSPAAADHRIAYVSGGGGAHSVRIVDMDAATDHDLGPGYWPSWSPDGTRLATCCATVRDVEDAIAGRADSHAVFEQPGQGDCLGHLHFSGRAICSVALWSPDGAWLFAADVAMNDLLIAPVDGSLPPRRLALESNPTLDVSRLPAAWQPIWP